MGTNEDNILFCRIIRTKFNGSVSQMNLFQNKRGRKRFSLRLISKRLICISALLLTPACLSLCGNKLIVARPAEGVLEVRLVNSDRVGGIQFSLRTSSDIVLGSLDRGDRTIESHWIVSSFRLSDSVVNVLILSDAGSTLSAGGGALVRIVYTESGTSALSSASLANVMAADAHADSLAIELENLIWSENSPLAGNADGSRIFDLEQNYPNPFNPSTVIAYRLNKGALVQLSVHDIAGREVAILVDKFQGAGEHRVEWNTDSKNGVRAASGLYFVRLIAGNESQTRRMMLIK
jgi:hypothetical protein